MTDNKTLQTRKEAATPRGVGVMCQFYAKQAENAEVWDVEGNRYIDFASGIAVLNTGHRHPKVVEAVKEQLDKFTHTCYQVVPYESYVALAEKINQLTPGNFAKKTAFFNSGAEAVENAIKIARAHTGRSGVIAFTGGFHGRTFMGMALTGKVAPYKINFGPFPGDVYHVPFPQDLHDVSIEMSKRCLNEVFKSSIEAKKVAAIIIEPVQGEGGFNVVPPEFFSFLRAVCDEHGIVLIADEVQTGFARTGKMFAMENYDVVPDLITMAKSMAGGFVLSGVCGKAEIMDAPAPGGLGGTYAGSPLGLAAAHAVIDVIENEKLCERANTIGNKLKDKLNSLKASVPQIAEVRGPGAMIAVEFNKPNSHEPDADFTKKVQQLALADGLILLTCGVYANVVRFLMPLTIQDSVFDEALGKIERAIKGAVG